MGGRRGVRGSARCRAAPGERGRVARATAVGRRAQPVGVMALLGSPAAVVAGSVTAAPGSCTTAGVGTLGGLVRQDRRAGRGHRTGPWPRAGDRSGHPPGTFVQIRGSAASAGGAQAGGRRSDHRGDSRRARRRAGPRGLENGRGDPYDSPGAVRSCACPSARRVVGGGIGRSSRCRHALCGALAGGRSPRRGRPRRSL